MANEDIFSNDSGIAARAIKVRVTVDDGAILNVAARANADRVDIAAQHAIEPDTRLRANRDTADDLTTGRNKRSVVDHRHLTVKWDEMSATHRRLSLNAHGDTHATADAERRETLFGIASRHFIQQRSQHACA